MNENQIRPETGGVCKFVLAWHKKKERKKSVKAEVCDDIYFKKSRIKYFATGAQSKKEEM